MSALSGVCEFQDVCVWGFGLGVAVSRKLTRIVQAYRGHLMLKGFCLK